MEYKVNDVIYVTIASVTPYGAFVNAENGYTGLIHISEITDKFVSDVNKFAQIDENIYAEIKEKGCLISEFPLGVRADKVTFPRRNRIL